MQKETGPMQMKKQRIDTHIPKVTSKFSHHIFSLFPLILLNIFFSGHLIAHRNTYVYCRDNRYKHKANAYIGIPVLTSNTYYTILWLPVKFLCVYMHHGSK